MVRGPSSFLPFCRFLERMKTDDANPEKLVSFLHTLCVHRSVGPGFKSSTVYMYLHCLLSAKRTNKNVIHGEKFEFIYFYEIMEYNYIILRVYVIIVVLIS